MIGVNPLVAHIRPNVATHYPPSFRARISRPVMSAGAISDPLEPPKVSGGTLLGEGLYAEVVKNMPVDARRYRAKIVFSSAEHGTTFLALLGNDRPPGYYILMIQTSSRLVGAFLSDPLTPKRGRYYGRPSTFLFDGTPFVPYRATGDNAMFMSVVETDLMIGGPRPAIFLMDGFSVLMSHPSDTFGSPSLVVNCDGGDPIIDLELFQLFL
jgi:hypothetical protein